MKRSYEIDMCNGPLFSRLLLFALPLMLSGILQLLFNAADIVVVGQFAGSNAMAAVGSTSSLINLLVNLFIGISVGANVLVARYYGSRSPEDVEQTVHTALITGFIGGFVLIAIGIPAARPMLELMGTPADVLDQAVLYMRIYFIGMPATMLYNFGAARAPRLGRHPPALVFLVCRRRCQCDLQPVFCHRASHGCGRRGHCYRDLPIHFGGAHHPVPRPDGRDVPPGFFPPAVSISERSVEPHAADRCCRPACRVACCSAFPMC